ncbi:MAG: TlpA family protein disulfide reductase [Cyclobacteriaceae bacterium]|nr:TlpA family protein disulfide reductase [Cyclobacteriaceae bacterium]
MNKGGGMWMFKLQRAGGVKKLSGDFRLIFFFIIPLAWSCSSGTEGTGRLPGEGVWRGVLHLQDQELPFNFMVYHRDDGPEIELMNGVERILLDEISVSGDSMNIQMHIFDTSIETGYTAESMTGYWQKNYLEDYVIPFNATFGETFRFTGDPDAMADFSGRWEVYFLSGSDSSLAVGAFTQRANRLEGTFLKTTGDYRYLEGEADGDSLKLSTFDGEHAYLFKGKMISEDLISGMYWSGKTWSQPWIARKNAEISLPDPDSLTFLRPGYDRIEFELPAMDGRPVSVNDPEFRDKVIILQIFGTWCSNCMDETRFLSAWYNRNRHRDVEIIAIAFERKDDLNYARERITRMKERFGINYEFLFGGKSDKDIAARVLPMLNTVVSFPTTIFIDKHGKVRKIHTGFSGPGTGIYYDKFVEEFNLFMDKLLSG